MEPTFKAGVPITLAYLIAYRENPPWEAQFKVNGATPLHRVEKLHDRVFKNLTDDLDGKINDEQNRFGAICVDVAESTLEQEKRLKALTNDMKAGRVTPQEVQREVRQIMQATDRHATTLDQIDRSAADVDALADLEPLQFEKAKLERFPALKQSLPLLTEDYLLGNGPDPLEPPRRIDGDGSARE